MTTRVCCQLHPLQLDLEVMRTKAHKSTTCRLNLQNVDEIQIKGQKQERRKLSPDTAVQVLKSSCHHQYSHHHHSLQKNRTGRQFKELTDNERI